MAAIDASGRTSPVHYRHFSNECYIGDIVQGATMSQKLLAHHDATATSELSVAAGSHEENIRSIQASSVDGIHWRVGASMRHLRSVHLCRMTVTPSVD